MPAILARLTVAAAVLALTAACSQTDAPSGGAQARDGSPVGRGAVSPAAAVEQPASAASRVKVVAVGDIACDPDDGVTSDTCHQRATARLAKRLAPRRVIALGDLQYEDGALPAFRASYDATWGRLKAITKAVPGNHEYHTSGASGFFDYWGLSSPGYRTATVHGWRIYLLNSNCGDIDCAAERAWFKKDLEAHPTTCSAMAMHFPRFSSGEHGNNPSMRGFWRIADRHGVDLALAGHDHDYERFAPMNAAGEQVSGGIISFVVGTGGRSFYHTNTHVRGSQYFRSDKFGVLLLKLGSDDVSWSFRTTGGRVRDAGTAACQ